MTEYQEMKLVDRHVGMNGLVHKSYTAEPTAATRVVDETCEKIGELPVDGSLDGVKVDELDPETQRKVRERREAIDARHSAVKPAHTVEERMERLWGEDKAER